MVDLKKRWMGDGEITSLMVLTFYEERNTLIKALVSTLELI
jgi:hypothetical protein